MDKELSKSGPWLICVLLAACAAVPSIPLEQVGSAAVNAIDIRKGVQTTGISLGRRISGKFVKEYNIFMVSNKQEPNSGRSDDCCGKKRELTGSQSARRFTASVKLSFVDKITEFLGKIKEIDTHNRSVEFSSGVDSSRRNFDCGSGMRDPWLDGGFSEGHPLQFLVVSGISGLLQNRSFQFRFIPGLIVNVLISITRPNVANISVKLIQDDGKSKNNFVHAGKVLDRFAPAK
jgi:hypothetical protein